MNDLSQQAISRYQNNFLREVEAEVEEGEWVRMCMQCGVRMVRSGSCHACPECGGTSGCS